MPKQKTRALLEHSFTQAEFDRFARLSGDDNPIHTDPVFAAQTRFGRTVAHGLLLCSVLHSLVDQLLPGGSVAEQSVMFTAPTFADEMMRFSAELIEASEGGQQVALEVKRLGDNEVTCRGQCRVAP